MLLEKEHTQIGGIGKKSKAQIDGSEKGRREGRTVSQGTSISKAQR